MKQKDIRLYDSYRIGELTIKNRFIRSAMFEFGANDGKITAKFDELYGSLAKGGSGLIITGMQAISATAGIGSAMVETTYSKYVNHMARVAAIVHENGAKLFVQLNHAGYRTDWKNGYDSFGVSTFAVSENYTYHEATQAEINEVVQAFGISALKCKEAGCDGVQIHAAHGFLINTFLSPFYNHRTDCYGGTIENRARILFEVYDSIRDAVGEAYPISVKLPFCDLVSPSITSDECIWVCKELEKRQVNLIEITSGLTMDGGPSSFTPFMKPDTPEGSFVQGAAKIAEAVNIPVASVCGYRTPDFIENVLSHTKIWAISLGRPLVCQPELPIQWRSNRSKAACISCNGCYKSKGIITCQLKKSEEKIDKNLS